MAHGPTIIFPVIIFESFQAYLQYFYNELFESAPTQ